MKLTLIRHGLTEGNLKRWYYGGVDIPLAPEGEAALRALREQYDYPTAPRYYTSGMIRTEQTLAILYGDQPHTVVPGLREMNFGDWEQCSYEDLKDDPAFIAWATGDVEHHVAPNGESFAQVYDRVGEAILPILEKNEDAVCVVHGGVIAFLLKRWFPTDLAHTYERTPEPGHGYQVTFTNGVPVEYIPVPFAK